MEPTTMAARDGERKDFEKFCKFFTTRLIQAVVQSRLGQKLQHDCSTTADNSDWFNVKIGELGEVTSEIRHATQGRFPPIVSDVCLDFHVRTSDGDMLPLECWCVHFDDSMCDDQVSVRGQLYHQMSIMLKSAIAAARVTQTYRYYARRQGIDSFIICYQIYTGAANVAQLGTEHRSITLGSLPGPFGTLSLLLHLRTKMVISGSERPQAPPVVPLPSGQAALIVTCGSDTQTTPPRPVRTSMTPMSPLQLHESPSDACFSTFSTSPASGDVPWLQCATSPGQQIQQQQIANLNQSVGSSGASGSSGSMAGTLQPSSGSEAQMRKNSSSGCIFGMEMSANNPTAPTVDTTRQRSTLQTGGNNSLYTTTTTISPQQQQTTVCSSSSCPQQTTAVERRHSGGGAQSGPAFPFSGLLTASQSAPIVAHAQHVIRQHCQSSSSVDDHTKYNTLPRITGCSRTRLSNQIYQSSQQLPPIVDEHSPTQQQQQGADTTTSSMQQSGDELDSSDDGFVKIPRAMADMDIQDTDVPGSSDAAELGDFVRQWKCAPHDLPSFEEPVQIDTGAPVNALPEQLRLFAAQEHSFDDFIRSLKDDENEQSCSK